MGVTKERLQDSHHSVWSVTPEDAAIGSAWARPLKALQRLTGAIKQARQERQMRPASQPQAHPQERSSGEMTTLPSGGRGQALREAHRELRRQMRRHPALRQVLPHLYYVEGARALHRTAALFDMPLWVMQRALPQLDRLPLDEHPDALDHPLHTLRLRLIEAIEVRSLQVAVEPPAPEHADSFHGSPDTLDSPDGRMSTLGPMSLPPAGIVVDELPDSAFDAPAVDPPHRNSPHHSGPDRRRR
jgi:hypothetical protein